MIIGVTGYGCTGASACIDLLKEYEKVKSYNSGFEFQLLQQPDGIVDLKYQLVRSKRRLSTNAAIKRFKKNLKNSRIGNIMKNTKDAYLKLSQEYIDSLISVSWVGNSLYDPIDLQRKLDRYMFRRLNRLANQVLGRINQDWHWPPKEERYFSFMDEESFDRITRDYITKILHASGIDDTDDSYIIMEQLFNTTNPLEGAEYFDNARSIVVDRDPRDVFLLTNIMMLKRLSGYMPCRADVEAFVRYYRALHTGRIEDPRILYVQYEDLIYDYENCTKRISEFLDGAAQIKKGQYFKPEYSINNTMLYQQYPQYKEQFAYIEKELSDLIYPFEEKKDSITFTPRKTKPFHSQSRVKQSK